MIRLRTILSSFFLASAAVVLLPSCKDDVTPGVAAAALPPIVFGVSLDIIGTTGTAAKSALPAIRALQYQVNSLGGIQGRPVEFRAVDDKGDADVAITAIFEQFAADNVMGVVGPINSGQVQKISSISIDRFAVVSPGATAVTLSDLNAGGTTWIFRTVPNDSLQTKAIVRFAQTRPEGSCTRLAVAYLDDQAYGAGLERGIRTAWPAANYAGSVKLPTNAKSDYAQEVSAIAALTPDCLALVCYDDTGGPFATSLTRARTTNPALFPEKFFVIGADGLRADGFIEKAAPDGRRVTSNANGFYGTSPDPNPRDRTQLTEFKTLRAQLPDYRATLDPFAASAYDAAALLVLARAVAGVDDPIRVRDELEAISTGGRPISPAGLGEVIADTAADYDYSGASGDVDFTPGGDVVSGYEVWNVQNGVFVTAANYPSADFQ